MATKDHASELPGFRFIPTEEELVSFYLEQKVRGTLQIPSKLILDVEFYCHDPWDLSAMASLENNKFFYFFVPRDRRYRNGSRPNRVTKSGYWKATGTDHKVPDSRGQFIGLKKTLVFYRGRAPKGNKTDWVMNEFRLPRTDWPNTIAKEEFDVTLCRMYQRSSSSRVSSRIQQTQTPPKVENSNAKDITCEDNEKLPSEDEKTPSEDEKSTESLGETPEESSCFIVDWSDLETLISPLTPELKIETKYLGSTSSASWLQFSPGILVTPTSIAGHGLWETQS